MIDKHTDMKAVGLTAVLLFAAAAVALSGTPGGDNVAEAEAVTADDSDNVEWVNHITVEKNGDVVHEGTNNLMDQGQDFVAYQISSSEHDDWGLHSSADGASAEVIGLSDSDSETHSGNSLDSEITSANLTRALGETNPDTETGEFEVEFTFIADNEATVHATGLYWACHETENDHCEDVDSDANGNYDDSLISSADFGQEASLEAGDTLTVTHEITISEG